MSDDNNGDFTSRIAVLLIGFGSAALVVTIYHCLAITWCQPRYRSRVTRNTREAQPYTAQIGLETPSSVENSMAQLIPAYKYQKSVSLAGGDDADHDMTCAICLCEFKEGEELRTLPECLHSYHVACIDMWLYSHSNCPMCRTDATPSSKVVLTPRESEPERSMAFHNMGLLQEVIVHSRTM